MYGSHDMRHTDFSRVDGGQRDAPSLGRHIYDYFLCCYVLHVHFLSCHPVLYKIVFDIYMFGFSMELKVFCISYSSLTITIDDHKLYGISLIDQMFQESS